MKNLGMFLILVGMLFLSSCTAEQTNRNTDKYRNYYEIFVGGFYDTSGNGVGDLNGVTKQLDYLNDGTKNSLGIDGIWLMPIMPSPTYHKYDVTDYKEIDPAYGTLEDFDRLIEECDKRGIAVIIDFVLNHTSDQHPWFTSAVKSLSIPDCGQAVCTEADLCSAHNPYCGYYMFTQEPGLPDYYDLGNGWYYQGVFWSGMPDLNLANEEVRREILEISQFWIDRGIAGYRLDAVTEFFDKNTAENVAFLKWFYDSVSMQKPDIYVVAEAWTDASLIERYYESGIDSLFNFGFSQQTGEIVKAVRSGNGNGLAMRIADWNGRISAINPMAMDAPFLSNHDNARSAGFLMNNTDVQKMCAAIYLFMPGVPFIYYGEEIGMTGSGQDENKRQPMVWSTTDTTGRPYPPAGADQTQSLEAGFVEQLKDKNSLLRFYIDAIALKNKFPEIARGTPSHIELENISLAAYRCDYEGASVYVVHNISDETITWSVPDDIGQVKLSGSLSASGTAVRNRSGTVTMPPYSTAVFSVTF